MEINDYELDMQFGKWLRNQRISAGFTLEQASNQAGLSTERIKSLELGYAEKSITQNESEKLSRVYKVALKEFIEKAIYSR